MGNIWALSSPSFFLMSPVTQSVIPDFTEHPVFQYIWTRKLHIVHLTPAGAGEDDG